MKGVQAEVMAALVSLVIHKKKKKTPQEKENQFWFRLDV